MNKISIIFTSFLLFSSVVFAQVGINATNAPPDPSAGLDVSFTNKGLLPPRVALHAINSTLPVYAPAVGLLVYNTAVAGTAPFNVMAGYYCWEGSKWTPVANPEGANAGDMQYWNGTQWVIVPSGSNGKVLTFTAGLPIWSLPSFPCGTSITVNHVAGAVAPVNKPVTYGTVTNIPGETAKCWITRNLGASQQATAVNDNTEASGGWFWQFNRRQGYQHDGASFTPNNTWALNISEDSDWMAENDPCVLEIGGGWRIPTGTEWTNVDASGGWNDWNGPWNSALKLHAAGFIVKSGDGNIYLFFRGVQGHYWAASQYSLPAGLHLMTLNSSCYIQTSSKPNGYSIRCLRD